MVIISRGMIHAFVRKHPGAIVSLNEWYSKTRHADWKNPHEMKMDFPSADYVGNDRYVFNIAGNHYHLIAMIHFGIRTVYIRGIHTHSEYDRLNDPVILTELNDRT